MPKNSEKRENPFPKGVAQPAVRTLHSIGATQLEHLTSVTEAELRALHGMGPKALEALRGALLEKGLGFREP